ncbi:MAG: hypothetical protein PHT69_16645 [Bacteroidales bacterium]|nr:hypothetical protein [Bacteroidales bacterium]
MSINLIHKTMKSCTVYIFLICIMLYGGDLFSQNVAINNTGNPANSSSMLDIQSSSRGLLIPRMTESERDNISNPAIGLMIYQIDQTNGFWFFDGSVWVQMGVSNTDNLYTVDGTLNDDRIVDQNNNNVTFVTGTAKTYIDGNFFLNGGYFGKQREITSSPTWQDDDFVMICTFTGGGNLYMPDPTLYPGRMLLIRNNSLATGSAGNINYQTYQPKNNTSILATRGHLLVSNGINWYVVTGH